MEQLETLKKWVQTGQVKTARGRSEDDLLTLIGQMEASLSKTNVSGSLPLNTKHQCFENGHAFYLVCEIDNGRSKYGDHKCSRCGHVEPFQYDYDSW